MVNQAENIKEMTLTRIFDAPRERVFKAWIDPKLVAQWWGPTGFTNPVCELDVRPGGAILIHMRFPDGSVSPMTGTFHEIAEPERLVFTSGGLPDAQGHDQIENLNTVTFTDLGGRTEVKLHVLVRKHSPAIAAALAGMEQGWSQSFDKLAATLK